MFRAFGVFRGLGLRVAGLGLSSFWVYWVGFTGSRRFRAQSLLKGVQQLRAFGGVKGGLGFRIYGLQARRDVCSCMHACMHASVRVFIIYGGCVCSAGMHTCNDSRQIRSWVCFQV